MDIREVRFGRGRWAWIGLIWLRLGTGGGQLLNAVMNLRVPFNGRNS